MTVPKLWCRLMHKTSWSLYGGFRKPFIYCRHCGRTAGYRESWRNSGNEGDSVITGRGGCAIEYSAASVSLRIAAERMAKTGRVV